MFTIDVDFCGVIPPKATYSLMTIDEIYDHLCWEANLSIMYNNQLFFSERVAIIEFYWYLVRWYRKLCVGCKDQFLYSTVEHMEPILTFTFHPQNYWKVDSTWSQCEKIALVQEETLCMEVAKLLETMMLEKTGDGSLS